MKIMEMASEYRPRERMQRLGSKTLSDAELLAVVLQKGTQKENVIDISHRLLADGLAALAAQSLAELQKMKGIGLAKSTQIHAAFELGRRLSQKKKDGSVMRGAKDVFKYASPRIGHSDQEQFMVILLDTKNSVIKDEIVTIGILDAALIHPREVFKTAIRESASSIILVHNHPSGDPTPSPQDLHITKLLADAGDMLDIPVIDHVIVGHSSWWSYKEIAEKEGMRNI